MNTSLWIAPSIQEKPLIQHPYSPFYHKPIGALFLSGGHGSRLMTPLPKALLPIPPSGKTLLEIFLRRAVGFFKIYFRWPHCILMTSQENEKNIQEYLHHNSFFGVPKEYVHFFNQSSLPLLDENNNPLIENGVLQTGPDGNGRIFASLHNSGLLDRVKEVEALSILPIDNPLMDPFLPALFQPILEEKKEAAILAIIRKTAQEQTGIFYQKGENLYVAEYTEVPSSIKEALSLDGNLLYQWANISVLCINPLIIDTLATLSLPIHKAKKIRNNQIIFKQEYFIFDTFPFLKSFALISLDRTKWFSPIKAKEGEDSLEKAAIAFERLQEEQARNASLFSNESKRASDIDPAILYGLPR